MNVRNWILVSSMALAPLFNVAAVSAQDTSPPATHECQGRHGHGRGDRMEHLTTILGLDANQQAAVRQIFEANRPRFQEIRQMTDATARQAAMQQLHTQTHASIDALLTPDQRATFDRIQAARAAHAGEHGGRRHGRRGGATGPATPPAGI